MPEPHAIITPKGAARLASGHPWVYRSDVRSVSAASGDIVRVTDTRGRFLARAFYSDRSQITLRALTLEDVPVDANFVADRIRAAAAYRKLVVQNTEAYRLVFGEADLLPSIIVDRYGDYLVVQTLSQGAEKLKPQLIQCLIQQFAPRGILERNDPRVRLLEGLDRKVSVLFGDVPEILIAEMNGLRFEFNLREGQKTGGFLDQRENYLAAAKYARGEALDCFTFGGGFALHLARAVHHVEAVDSSVPTLTAARRNAAHNGVNNITLRESNVFDLLKEYDRQDRRFDTVVLDPPAFAKNRASLPAALAGYKEINLRAIKLLRPGGFLITCSCSHHLTVAEFAQTVAEAAVDAGRVCRVAERRTQAQDHPIVLTVPETVYLKVFILQSLT